MGRNDSRVCQVGGGTLGVCRRDGVIYFLIFLRLGRRKIYFGETGRRSYERTKEHWALWRNIRASSCLWKHSVEDHSGELKEDDVR